MHYCLFIYLFAYSSVYSFIHLFDCLFINLQQLAHLTATLKRISASTLKMEVIVLTGLVPKATLTQQGLGRAMITL